MDWKWHGPVGALAGFLTSGLPGVLPGAAGGLFPDVDHRDSMARRILLWALLFLAFAGQDLQKGFQRLGLFLLPVVYFPLKHRGFLHSVSAALLGFGLLSLTSPEWALPFLAGYLSHLALDGPRVWKLF